MNTLSHNLSDEMLDAAACDALGANTPAESATYQQQLAGSHDDQAKRLDRDLRETVARLAAASPHMAPPPDLRGRILQATAPVSFRMEDYRKATEDNGRFYKWGFYAAMLFLMAGAWFNYNANQRTAQYANLAKERGDALSAFVNPSTQQLTLYAKDGNGKPYGKALIDSQSKTAVVLLPEGMIPKGMAPQLSVPEDGKKVVYKTLLVNAPGDFLTAPKNTPIDTVLNIDTTTPDNTQRPRMASQR